jgi:GTP-binding protein HflX
MFDRPGRGTEAVLVALDVGEADYTENLAEICQLAASAGVTVHAVIKGRRLRPDPATFAGRGKVEEIAAAVAAHDAALAIFNHDHPRPERNLGGA